MKSSEDIRTLLLEYGEDRLADWLLAYLRAGHSESPDRISGEDSPVGKLLDCLDGTKDGEICLRLGNAACRAYRTFVEESYSWRTERVEEILVVTDLLSVIGYLPCSKANGEQIASHMLFLVGMDLLGGKLRREEVNLRSRMLLTLASKLSPYRSLKPNFAQVFKDDLSHPDYAVPAYAVILKLNVSFAAKHFRTVLEALRNSHQPTKHLVRDIATVVRDQERDSDKLFDAVIYSEDQEVKEEFLYELGGAKAKGIMNRLDEILSDAEPRSRKMQSISSKKLRAGKKKG